MANTVKKHVTMSPHTIELVSAYATRNRLSFSAAISELCLMGLSVDADEPLAPRVTEIVEREGEYLLHRIDDRMGFMLEAIREDVRAIVNGENPLFFNDEDYEDDDS